MNTSDNSDKSTLDAIVQLQLIADALPVLVLNVDENENCLFTNQTFQRWFGQDPVAAQGRPVRLLLGDESYRTLREPLRRALRGERVQLETTVTLPQGAGPRLLAATCVPGRSSSGAVNSAVLLLEDISERKRMSSSGPSEGPVPSIGSGPSEGPVPSIGSGPSEGPVPPEQVIEELTRTVRLNQLFTSILSHDLRNPLQSMLTAAEILIRKAPEPKFAATAGRIVTSGNRMNRMIGQLLEFSRLRSAGGPTLEIAATDVASTWRQAIEELSKGDVQRVQLEHSGNTTGHWDPERLAQIAANLVGNALRHGTPDGTVTIEIDGNDASWVTVHIHNGGAIREELLPKLFEPFQDGDRRGPRGDGLGLGLYITRQIVLAHGGTVDVTSSSSDGTEFRIRLPREQPANPGTAAAPSPS